MDPALLPAGSSASTVPNINTAQGRFIDFEDSGPLAREGAVYWRWRKQVNRKCQHPGRCNPVRVSRDCAKVRPKPDRPRRERAKAQSICRVPESNPEDDPPL